MIDDRILRVGIELDGVMNYYEKVKIKASGSKTNNSTQNSFNISISNLSRKTIDYITTNNNILNRTLKNKRITVEAGRVSTGVSLIFTGDIRMINVTQPPNITVNVKTYTGDALKGVLISTSTGAMASLSSICQTIATSLNKKLTFQANDKTISNYTFTGASLEQIRRIENLGNLDVTIDNDTMIVKNENVPLDGRVFLINSGTGMIGLPTTNERGISVKTLFNNNITVGSTIRVTSEINIALNGDYVVYEIKYDLANRDTPFYTTFEGTRLGI